MLLYEEGSRVEAGRLEKVQRPCDLSKTQVKPATVPPEVRDAMLAALPSLRAFAISLTSNRDAADDLVQDAILRAWKNIEKFEPGTNLQAWLFTILRNGFYSTYRKRQREVADPEGFYAGRLRSSPEQNGTCDAQDVLRALEKVPADQREALLLIVAEGLSYEDAAQACGTAVGTIKSRVHRARQRLAQLLAVEDAQDLGPDRVMQAVLQSAG
jgi:RNA polymerase sigma-70 factor (ECF subfamily)